MKDPRISRLLSQSEQTINRLPGFREQLASELPRQSLPLAEAIIAIGTPKPTVGGLPRPLVLNASAPFDTAKTFAASECHRDGKTIVWYWQGQFWRWNGVHYSPEPDDVIRGQIYKFLDNSRKKVGSEGTARFQPTPRHVNEVFDCLKVGLALGLEFQPPMWLESKEATTDWITFKNAIVNVVTGETRPLSPDFWAHNALSFEWDPDAKCPTWETFMPDIFPDDRESQDFIEEYLGYCMTDETRFGKAAMFIGAKRSGKGTVSYVAQKLVGESGYVGLSFSTWTAGENSKECLIGKKVGVFADVRFKQGRMYGMSFDPGGIGHTSKELILNITGEDAITIGRKYRSPWHGQLKLKLIVISNEVPNLNDGEGALPSRFIKVHFARSFFGQEDIYLREKLTKELSGIAVRCLSAYRRAVERGRFVQPKSAEGLERQLIAASDPFAAMAMDCFEPDPSGEVVKAVSYFRFELWCKENGRPDLLKTTPDNRFGAKLRAVSGYECVSDLRRHGQPRSWIGIRLKKQDETD